jgi:copper chaperone
MSAEAAGLVCSVPTISCNHCKMAIERAVSALDGVESVEVDVEGKSVAVRFAADRVDEPAIRRAIEDEGYEVAGAPRGAA